MTSVHQAEQAKWDALAETALAGLTPTDPDLTFAGHATRSATMPGVAEFLGDLSGQRVLEYGCGMGALSVLLARAGAEVTSFDISAGSVRVARRRAELDGVADRIEFVVCPGEELPFADASFDVAFGKAVLHHLDVPRSAPHLARVVRPGGKAAFVEPMGMNPVLSFVRDHVPYPHKNPPDDDRPVDYDEIRAWGAGFARAHHREIQLLSMLERGLGFGRPLPALRRADDWVLRRVPALRRHCRYVVLTFTR